MAMMAVMGCIKNNEFVSDDGSSILDGRRVVVTVLDEESTPRDDSLALSDTGRQRSVWADFFEAMENDPEKLPPEFDEIISKGIKFREVDFS
jgi:hypothetical protein